MPDRARTGSEQMKTPSALVVAATNFLTPFRLHFDLHAGDARPVGMSLHDDAQFCRGEWLGCDLLARGGCSFHLRRLWLNALHLVTESGTR